MRAYSQPGSPLDGVVIAPVWRRALAWMTDAMLVLAAELVVGMIAVSIYALLRYLSTAHLTLNFNLNEHANEYAWVLPSYLFTGYLLYHSLFLTFWHGRTPGRAFLLICVMSKQNQQPALWQAFVRTLLQPISTIPVLLGYLAFQWSKRNSSLHDLLVGTVVLQEEVEHRLIFGSIEPRKQSGHH